MRLVWHLFLVGILAACSKTPAPDAPAPVQECPPAEVELELSATDRLNPSPDGGARPVQVRVYQLQTDARLHNSSFEEVWQNGADVLATDLKSMTEYTVYPGKTQVVSLKRDPEAPFLSLVALFREPQGKDWFISYELEPAPTAPPCVDTATLPVLLDRMQIQDGEGQVTGQSGEATPAEATERTGDASRPDEGE